MSGRRYSLIRHGVIGLCLFFLGIMVTGIFRIPADTLGVRRFLWHQDPIVILNPGIHIVWPLTHRVTMIQLTGDVVLGHYMMGNFRELKQVEMLSADNFKIGLHVIAHYSISRKRAADIIHHFDGQRLDPYIEYHLRGTLTAMIRDTMHDQLKPPALDLFLVEAAHRCQAELGDRGVELDHLSIEIMPGQPPEIHPADSWTLEKFRLLASEEYRN
ncbi:hypothetical protein JXA80_00850 [bacterium]|nr:hypothetical protein [candidate division CSSED10-310 bacterium]